jgi:hypothetical protein
MHAYVCVYTTAMCVYNIYIYIHTHTCTQAAALKDAGLARIIGERTFGKNTVQAIVRLKNEGALQLTIGRFESPSESLKGGRCVCVYECMCVCVCVCRVCESAYT